MIQGLRAIGAPNICLSYVPIIKNFFKLNLTYNKFDAFCDNPIPTFGPPTNFDTGPL